MIEQNIGWSVCCDKCNKNIIGTFDSEEEAKQMISSEGYLGNKTLHHNNVCVFCSEVVCSDCQVDVGVKAYRIPVCEECASERLISELVEEYEKRR